MNVKRIEALINDLKRWQDNRDRKNDENRESAQAMGMRHKSLDSRPLARAIEMLGEYKELFLKYKDKQ